MKNIVIYGGGFDPIHNGHINMAINASKKLDAEVFFVPAHVSVWKEKTNVSDEDKVKMIELAIKESENPRLHISLFEIESKEETNYSIDTVRYFKETYPDSKLYLLIGTDQVNKFHKWKECDELAELAQIVLFERPGFDLDQENLDRFNIEILKGDLVDVSSTDIRECRNLNVPYSVLKYIIDHELYFVPIIKSYMNEKRYLHSVSVANLAYEIAVENGFKDAWRYFLAGILHDIGKDMPIIKQKEIVGTYFEDYLYFPTQIIHQFVGRYLAEKDFDIQDREILEAIEYHTTGHPDMGTLAKVIYASDKIEPTRGFDSSEYIKAMKVNAEEGFLVVLAANKQYFIDKQITYDNELTKATMEKFLDNHI